jgi:hypothetical protein
MDNDTATTISVVHSSGSGKIVAEMSAGSGSTIDFDGPGKPRFIGFSKNGRCEVVEGNYGFDSTGTPENRGRLTYKQSNASVAIPYIVTGSKDIYEYHLKYLELTTVKEVATGYYVAYCTKAVAFDNSITTLTQKHLTYKLPEDGELVISNGKLKFGDIYVIPNYDLTGTEMDACAKQKDEISLLENWVSYDRSKNAPTLTTNERKLAAANSSLRECRERQAK